MTIPDFSCLAASATVVAPDDAAIRARFEQVAGLGVLRHAVPEPHGGLGDGFEALRRTHRALGEASGDPGLLLMVNAHLWGAVFPILYYGDGAQRERFLPPLLDGAWLAGQAITEPHGGSDLQALRCRAERDGGGFILHGEKRYITNVPLADWLVVYARLDEGLTGFLVSREDSGCRLDRAGALRACRGGATGSVHLDGCRVGSERRLGPVGAGARMAQRALELERAFVFAGIAGVMEAQLQRVIRHSRERQASGAHLGRHQAISHRIAEMKLRLDTVDLWLRECARLSDAGQRLTLAAAETKLYAAEAFLQSSLDAVQILGAAGLETDGGQLGWVEDALAGRLFSGSSEIQKNLIAGLLGTGDGYKGRPPR